MRLLRSPSPAPLAGGKEEGMQLLLSPSPAPLTGGKEEGRRRRAVVGRGSLGGLGLSVWAVCWRKVFVAFDCPLHCCLC